MPAFGPEYTARKVSVQTGEIAPASVEASGEIAIPTISVDRALGHLLKSVDSDITEVQDFYDGLPHDDKVSLDNLHIHLSAAKPVNIAIDTVLHGYFAKYGTKHVERRVRKATPELPPTVQPTVVVFLGGHLIRGEDAESHEPTVSSQYHDEVPSFFLTETAAHEIAHFAQMNPADLEGLSVASRVSRWMHRGMLRGMLTAVSATRDLAVGAGAGLVSEVVARPPGMGSVVIGGGTAGLSYFANRKARTTQRLDRDFEYYQRRENEQDAEAHAEDVMEDLCSVELLDEVILPGGYDFDSFVKPEDKKMRSMVANYKHKNLSMTPRGGDPKEIEKRANRSAMKASLREFKTIKQKPLLKRK